MSDLFELEWMGGPAEHRFRKIRPGTEDLPWGTLDTSTFHPNVLEAARGSWTEVAINEYRAIAAFSAVLRALAEARAPLDLLGMTSDFLADECAHVELASRMAMELGGAAARTLDVRGMTPSTDHSLTPLQRANELVLRISCIAEAFSGGTAAGQLASTPHALPRAIYESILRDESHHRRLGGLYFDWASEKMDDAERARLTQVTVNTLKGYARYWTPRPSRALREGWPLEELRALGWLEQEKFVPLAREVVVRDILDPLQAIGICVSDADRQKLLQQTDSAQPP